MSDENEVEHLLENFQKALDTLNNIGNVEALISKLDAHKNRKLLKRVKHVVNEVHTKVGTVKEKVSKAYKRVKIRSSSESEDFAITGDTDKGASDREEDPLGHSNTTQKNVDDEYRCESPVIGGKGKVSKRSTRQTDKSQKDKNEQNDSLQNSNNTSDTLSKKIINDNDIIMEEDHQKDSLDKGGEGMDVDNPEANEDRNIGIQDIAEEQSEQTTENEIVNVSISSSQEIIEGTPEKSSTKVSLSLSLYNNKSNNERGLLEASEIVETSSEEKKDSKNDEVEKVKKKLSESKQTDQQEKKTGKEKPDEITDTVSESETSKNNSIKKNTTREKANIDEDDEMDKIHKKSRGKKDKNKDSDEVIELNDTPEKLSSKKIKHSKRGEELKESDSNASKKKDNTAKTPLDEPSDNDETDNNSNEEESKEKGTDEDEIVAIEDKSKKTKHKKSRGKNDKTKDSDDEEVELNDTPEKLSGKKIKHSKRGEESKNSDSEEKENTAKNPLDAQSDSDETDMSSNEKENQEKGTDEDEIVTREDTRKKTKHKKSRGKKDENSDTDKEDKLNDTLKKSSNKKIKQTKQGEELKGNTEKMENTGKKSLDKSSDRCETDKSNDKDKNQEKGTDYLFSSDYITSKIQNVADEDEIVTIDDTLEESDKNDDENGGNDSSNNDSADPKLTENSVTPEDETKERPPIPKIKLVDINKLLAPNTSPLDVMSPSPKTKKSVTFDSSVIILSSSDEETPKKDPKSKDPSPLKSAMRKSSSRKAAAHNDSDSKENKEKSKSIRTTRHSKQENKILISDNSSDDSDFEDNRRSRRIRKHEACLKDKFSKLAMKHGERKSRAAARRILRSKDEHDSDREHSNEKKKKKGAKDKKLHSEDSEEEGSTDVKNKKRRRKKDILEISNISDHSDMSDSAFEVSSKGKSGPKSRTHCKKARVISIEPDKNDLKLRTKVYIPLPLFKCEELPEIYKRKKDIFEVKKLTNMDFTRRTRSTRNGSSKNSDDSDKPDKKRIKLTLKLKKNVKAKEDSSDDERSSSEENHVDKEKGGKSDAVDTVDVTESADAGQDPLVEACLEQIKDQSDQEQSEESKSDEDNTSKKTDKNKKNKNRENNKDCDKDSAQDADQKSAEKDKDKEPKVNGVLSGSDENSDGNQKDDKDKEDDSTDEDDGKKKKGKNWKNDKLLTNKIDSSDSDEDFTKFSKKKDKSNVELVRKAKKRMKKAAVISDSDSDNEKKSKDSDDDYNSEKSSESDSGSGKGDKDDESDQEEDKKKAARKRIKRVKDSSSDDDDKSTRKHLRKMIDKDSLSDTTKKAEQEEKERKARISDKQQKYNQIFALKLDATVEKVVLDFDEKTDKALLSVSKKLVKQLKPHQVIGVKFMWDACFESLARLKKDKGSGCILAHCMGLGKTLQVIALIHTLLSNSDETKVEKILVVCPVNTVLNWKSEFRKWLPKNEFEVYDLVSCKTSSINHERNYIVKEWHENGGVLIIGYNMFRTLSNPDNKAISKKLRHSFQEGLVDPGPDLIVCDEGHLLKNEKTHLSIAMNRIRTQRRIVLTGTPLQNNLKEYWCMVQFIKPNLLGTYKEYMNRFVNPIINGQYTDSTQHDIAIMRRRSHVLHKLLDGVVQRQDYSVLEPYLPPKYEYVLFLKLTEVQVKLYSHYMEHFARKSDGSNRTSFLFTDFQQLQRMCTHPRVLLDKSSQDKEKEMNEESDSEGSLKEFIDDDSEAKSTSSSGSESKSDSDVSIKSDEKKKKKNKGTGKRKRVTRAQAANKRENGEESDSEVEVLEPKEWWQEYIDKEELDNINHSAKTFLLFEILRECEEIGDKILVFSQSLFTLNCIEYFLQRIDEATQKGETEKVGGYSGSWAIGLDYFRLDGSSSCDNRASWCDQFNDPDNTRARLFLISTKAGGLGINLVAANRVIIFDVSWNPSHDIQSIYRVYRFGQTKPSYIYRFVTYGAMEMKIYERQVTKQAISKRVIDEQQIDRHYSQNDIQELYKTDLNPQDRPIPLVPKDVLLGEMLQKYENTIFKYHEHQSLLENKQDEELNEDERKAAWDEFENEKVVRKTSITNFGGINLAAFQNSMNFSPQLIQVALANIVRKDNPLWSDVQIRGILPALVTQLQMQMSENDFSMYNRVQQEIRLMQALQAQRMRENYLKQYQLQMLQKQQMANQLLGNLNVNPEELRRLQAAASQNYIHPSSPRSMAGGSGDVIELND